MAGHINMPADQPQHVIRARASRQCEVGVAHPALRYRLQGDRSDNHVGSIQKVV